MLLEEVRERLWLRFVDVDINEESDRIVLSFHSNQLTDQEVETELIKIFDNKLEDLNLIKEEDRFVCFFADYEDIEETLDCILNETV